VTDELLLQADESPGASRGALPVRTLIRQLLGEQPYAVLCTQGGGQPYGALVALAVTDDLASMVFATPKATRKYRLLSECNHVALVVDSRSTQSDDMMQIEALTITGRATEVTDSEDGERVSHLLLGRHSQLKSFVAAPSTALFRVEVVRYFHVTRFQEVREWKPTRGSSH
jgi:nitroimidazol reductase NimA-like FMN-containing flavoprotein (pyridoxamine 5'-phosphate oxidase superfamily)